MTLEDLLNLRGLDLASAYLREVIRCDEKPPHPMPHMTSMVYSIAWASGTWSKVRFRYNVRAAGLGLAQQTEYPIRSNGHRSKGPFPHTITLNFKGEPPVEISIVSLCENDLYLLAGIHLYIRMVKAGAVKPRAES